jgi:hypothetical protein
MWEWYVVLTMVNIVASVINMVICIWNHDTQTLLPWVFSALGWGGNFFWGLRRLGENK